MPQLADAAEVFAAIAKRPGVSYPVLVPNLQGYERARAVGAEEVAVFTAASEAFNRKNINASIDESIERFAPVLEAARADGVKVRGYVSTVLGCPYQGDVAVADVVRVAERMHALGCYEISLGDTIGIGTPAKARAMLRAVAAEIPDRALAVHFHDTRGQALANILACLEEGVAVVDSSGLRHRRLSLRERRDRQRRHRRCRLHARRHGHRDRCRPDRSAASGPLHFRVPAACIGIARCAGARREATADGCARLTKHPRAKMHRRRSYRHASAYASSIPAAPASAPGAVARWTRSRAGSISTIPNAAP